MSRRRIIIIGAAGRDFHNFNTVFRHDPDFEVVAFTATQIPEIDERNYPPELSGDLYPNGIPIHPMDDLEELIDRCRADTCIFSYSDVHYVDLMHVCNRVVSSGADFQILAPARGHIESSKPVVSVLAVRTGCGKSQTTRRVAQVLQEDLGVERVVAIRHPMPYGDLAKQAVQRYGTIEDLERHSCTIEEMEEYEPHISAGTIVYSGIDYGAILAQAETEADVILWDGGNNDPSFYRPDLTITVADPLRVGHERLYWAGEANATMADVVLINKCDSADADDIEKLKESIRSLNQSARILTADSVLNVEDPALITGRRVLVIEDGPTLTHGEMALGAGAVAARRNGAREIVDPRPFAKGSLASAFSNYPHLGPVVPALGYYGDQLKELEETIAAADCDSVVIGTPIDLRRVISIDRPATRVRYELSEHDPAALKSLLAGVLSG